MNLRDKRRVFLAVEQLEDRWVPARIAYANGVLAITNLTSVTPAALTIQQSATTPNTFSVTDGTGTSTFTFSGVSTIVVDAGNAAHTVLMNTNGSIYTGNFVLNAHNGNDSISITNSTGTGGILGNTTVVTGTGNDSVTIGGAGTSMTFGGNITLANSSGTESVTIGGTAGTTTVLGQLSITDARNILLNANLVRVGGGVAIQDAGIGNSSITLTAGAGAGTRIDRFLIISGGSAADSTTINGGILTVNGNTIITMGQGNDTFTLSATSTFNGNFLFNSGAGNDLVNVTPNGGTTTTFNGNVSFNLGSNGSDSLTLDTATVINGSLGVIVGNGNDSLQLGSTVFGNVALLLGNGNDTVNLSPTVGNAPTGVVSIFAGNGSSSITLGTNGAAAFQGAWNVQFNFGTGTDTVTLATSAATPPGTITGSIFSLNPNGNVFNQNGWIIVPHWSSTF